MAPNLLEVGQRIINLSNVTQIKVGANGIAIYFTGAGDSVQRVVLKKPDSDHFLNAIRNSGGFRAL